MNLETLQSNIGNVFKSEDLLKEALTHRSYVNENANWPFRNNERLEFLGDAVLELCVTEDLFERYGNREEGDMTIYRAALVNSKMLSRIAREIGLDKEMLASKGEIKEISNGGGENILGDGVEALIGSIYIDSGLVNARKFVRRFVMVHIED
ncbi:MAG: ribonuclease III domain-containing protein, partial [Patescibacteria group bacterium]